MMNPDAPTPTVRGRNGGRPVKASDDTKPVQVCRCVTWDFTSWCSVTGQDPHVFYKKLQGYFKSCEWSLEKAPSTGALHWQGRGNLYKKLRPGTESAEIAKELGLSYFKPTSLDNKTNANYQEKVFSHVAGPWSFKKPPPLKTSDVDYIERSQDQLPFYGELREYLTGAVDPREILWVYDHLGKSFKSAVQAKLAFDGLLEILPFVENHKDLLQFAYGFSHQKAYCVNIARGCAPKDDRERKDFASFIAGLESLKDGFVYDIRNFPKKEMMERPHVVVFANCRPMLDSATRDRWRIVCINEQMQFENITASVLQDHDSYMAQRRIEWHKKKTMREMTFENKWEVFMEKNKLASFRAADLERIWEERQVADAKKQKARLEYLRPHIPVEPPCKKLKEVDGTEEVHGSEHVPGFPMGPPVGYKPGKNVGTLDVELVNKRKSIADMESSLDEKRVLLNGSSCSTCCEGLHSDGEE